MMEHTYSLQPAWPPARAFSQSGILLVSQSIRQSVSQLVNEPTELSPSLSVGKTGFRPLTPLPFRLLSSEEWMGFVVMWSSPAQQRTWHRPSFSFPFLSSYILDSFPRISPSCMGCERRSRGKRRINKNEMSVLQSQLEMTWHSCIICPLFCFNLSLYFKISFRILWGTTKFDRTFGHLE